MNLAQLLICGKDNNNLIIYIIYKFLFNLLIANNFQKYPFILCDSSNGLGSRFFISCLSFFFKAVVLKFRIKENENTTEFGFLIKNFINQTFKTNKIRCKNLIILLKNFRFISSSCVNSSISSYSLNNLSFSNLLFDSNSSSFNELMGINNFHIYIIGTDYDFHLNILNLNFKVINPKFELKIIFYALKKLFHSNYTSIKCLLNSIQQINSKDIYEITSCIVERLYTNSIERFLKNYMCEESFVKYLFYSMVDLENSIFLNNMVSKNTCMNNSIGNSSYFSNKLYKYIIHGFRRVIICVKIILYGPPGCGKSMLSKMIRSNLNCNYFFIKSPSILNKFVGESEKRISLIFKKAINQSPSLLIFDEIDSILCFRDLLSENINSKITNQFLIELDELNDKKSIFLIGTTNFLEQIDYAILRSGRFDVTFYIPYPSSRDIIRLIKQALITKNVGNRFDLLLTSIALFNEYLTASDIKKLVEKPIIIFKTINDFDKNLIHFNEYRKFLINKFYLNNIEHTSDIFKSII